MENAMRAQQVQEGGAMATEKGNLSVRPQAPNKDDHRGTPIEASSSTNAAGGSDAQPTAIEPPSEQPQDGTPDLLAKYTVYTQWQKRLIVLAASVAALFSPLTAQIYLPALTVLASDFDVTASQINLTVTTYMVFQGVTPMFIGGLADAVGRRPAYIICFVIYLAANVGLACSRSYVGLLVVRCIQSAGSSTTVALCQAVVADIVTSAERGQYIGFTVIPTVLGPSLGPVLGGLLTQYLG
jgi:sugar phosphate permease